MSTVTKYLGERRVDFLVFARPAEFARALGATPGIVARTIVLESSEGPVLAVVPASSRLERRRVAAAIGDRRVRVAPPRVVSALFPEYEIGAVPPLAGLVDAPIYIDRELARHETIVFASGTQAESVKMRTADVLADPKVTIAPLCEGARAFDFDF